MKAVPGRKTDVEDAVWIAELLRHGLLKASFIPSRQQRDLRELTPPTGGVSLAPESPPPKCSRNW